MKILLVATKPPWPLIDGGRLLLWHTMAGLVRHGAEITLVAPVGAGNDCAAVGHELRTLCRRSCFLAVRDGSRIAKASVGSSAKSGRSYPSACRAPCYIPSDPNPGSADASTWLRMRGPPTARRFSPRAPCSSCRCESRRECG